ncbi:alpha/beta-tubulin-N-acetyltransferase 9 [Toxorhynchites rutilus septentrionalis]|uniref:alpha/beta-tubulin-N-acetyltransferase 9 n=1 Tax=Toxorhynchites rutilus septentrionalis TaxID=329112 RepID=UPI00247AA7A9|nr:alpha/beta-tubulin-N-acetyltransferase 9 [Toxorhynchites rutilus septentrionalis]XP_055630855.1 alpha/beta-tubulin-N-acetyltransferase 9 [Toxorhynchites rutilus septentrionalis]XP_055630857.1 alpha/beta-tubulin-N-acetyltransferase 9 [Toxorhynchites rutilus septentrionalis]
MKLNENLKIVGSNVILVPYERKHVEKYHQWMKSEELQELTASEPLTLEEEYQMQQSWREDNDKCTFLILDKADFEQHGDEIRALVGDTNIFLQSETDDDDDNIRTGEIEIMIAEQLARGKRYGRESTLLMLLFGIKQLHITRYKAITKENNTKAIKMFESFGFRETKRVAVFKEVTFEKLVDEEWLAWIEREVSLKLESYHKR